LFEGATAADFNRPAEIKMSNVMRAKMSAPRFVKGVKTDEHKYISEIDGHENAAILYSPKTGKDEKRPIVLFIHGGGWAMGTCFGAHHALCMKLCQALKFYILSIDHRMAPEHPFPIPTQDCYSALLWLANSDNTITAAADRENIILMGDSAGGNLAAVTTMRWRDENPPGITVVHQVLLYPCFYKRPFTKRYVPSTIAPSTIASSILLFLVRIHAVYNRIATASATLTPLPPLLLSALFFFSSSSSPPSFPSRTDPALKDGFLLPQWLMLQFEAMYTPPGKTALEMSNER
jgi:acetyl esterase/lipase